MRARNLSSTGYSNGMAREDFACALDLRVHPCHGFGVAALGSVDGEFQADLRRRGLRVLENLLLDDVQGGFTRNFLEEGAPQTTIYDASVAYAEAGVPLVVLAGKEYGSGSSRDWAAKGTALLGVKAVVAQSYERIHRSNLLMMGVLPLQFPEGQDAERMVAEVDAARSDGDTLGGVVEVVVWGLPPGLGSHVHWDRRLDAQLAVGAERCPDHDADEHAAGRQPRPAGLFEADRVRDRSRLQAVHAAQQAQAAQQAPQSPRRDEPFQRESSSPVGSARGRCSGARPSSFSMQIRSGWRIRRPRATVTRPPPAGRPAGPGLHPVMSVRARIVHRGDRVLLRVSLHGRRSEGRCGQGDGGESHVDPLGH